MQLREWKGFVWLTFPGYRPWLQGNQKQALETSRHITSTGKSREKQMHLCWQLVCCPLAYFTLTQAAGPSLGDGAAHGGLDPIDMPTGEHDLDNTSLRLSSQMILDCIKLKVKTHKLSIPLPCFEHAISLCLLWFCQPWGPRWAFFTEHDIHLIVCQNSLPQSGRREVTPAGCPPTTSALWHVCTHAHAQTQAYTHL